MQYLPLPFYSSFLPYAISVAKAVSCLGRTLGDYINSNLLVNYYFV
jgi:hypothetical protein